MTLKGQFLKSYMRLLIIGNQNKFLEMHETPSYRTELTFVTFFCMRISFFPSLSQLPAPAIQTLSLGPLGKFNKQICI